MPGGAFYSSPQQLLALPNRSFPQTNDLLDYSFANDNIPTALGDAYAVANPSLPASDGVSLSASMDLVVANLGNYPDNMVATYPGNNLGRHFRDAAWAFRETDCSVAVISDTGYDPHVSQGGVNGAHANLLNNLASGLAAFHEELSILPALWGNTVVVVVSEFGRTDINGSGGTDHGKAGLSLVMGGKVAGGAYNCSNATWYNGVDSPLENDGALDHRTDFRTIFAEIFGNHVGLTAAQIDQIIPDWSTIRLNPDIDHPFEFTALGLL